jgi:hypothetical protein
VMVPMTAKIGQDCMGSIGFDKKPASRFKTHLLAGDTSQWHLPRLRLGACRPDCAFAQPSRTGNRHTNIVLGCGILGLTILSAPAPGPVFLHLGGLLVAKPHI